MRFVPQRILLGLKDWQSQRVKRARRKAWVLVEKIMVSPRNSRMWRACKPYRR